jgi:transcriptional regulator with XRE-family HTH domain
LVRARHEGRNGEVWHRYAVRMQSQERIADDLGITPQRVSQIIAEVRASVPAVDKQQMIASSLELIAHVKDQALELVEMAGAPIFVGKDGSIAYDEKGNVVRDYSMRINALKTALAADDVMAKRLGLDAATKTEVSGSVRYEIAGVDLSDLS